MSNTMTAHEPIHYLDSILNEEEKRCEYSHQWRNFTISRSGRFKTKSKNKKRDVVDGKLFDAVSNSNLNSAPTTSASMTAVAVSSKEGAINNNRMTGKQEWHNSHQNSNSFKSKFGSSSGGKPDNYKNFYETNF